MCLNKCQKNKYSLYKYQVTEKLGGGTRPQSSRISNAQIQEELHQEGKSDSVPLNLFQSSTSQKFKGPEAASYADLISDEATDFSPYK